MKQDRDEAACVAHLNSLSDIARNGSGNLLAVAVECARARATLGEIADAMETAFGRHKPINRIIKDVYSAAYEDDPQYQAIEQKVSDYTIERGSAAHVLIAKMGQDGHDRGAKIIATTFADLGFTVDMTDMFSTPEETADLAIKLGVDAVGVSSLAAGHKTLVPELINLLKAKNAAHIKVFVGGVIPEQDYGFLRDAGVCEIFGPGTNVLEAAYAMLAEIAGLRRNR